LQQRPHPSVTAAVSKNAPSFLASCRTAWPRTVEKVHHGHVRNHRSQPPTVITTARESAAAEFDRRRKRYAIMMAGRALCVIAAALVYRESALLAVALVVGGAVLPWCAVILANDGPPKKRAPVRPHVAGPVDHALPAPEPRHTLDS
jgi:Protein of unknown function (DUF3099)